MGARDFGPIEDDDEVRAEACCELLGGGNQQFSLLFEGDSAMPLVTL